MNVAIFTDNDFSKVNGVTTTLRAVLEHAPADIRARVYVPPFRRFRRHAASDGIDLIHFTTPGPVGLAALHVSARLGIPMVGSFHTDLAAYTGLLSGSPRLGALMQEYLRWPYGKCARILAPSEATRQTLIRGKINPAKIDIWRRGVLTERFTPLKRSSDLRRAWGVGGGRLALLYVGRVSKEKGLDLLAPLSERLRRLRIDHRLIVVGDGPMSGELRDRCEGAVFTGTLSPDDVARTMASSDLFVFPSRTDTAGNVVLEAQASGLPVLVTDDGGPSENMVNGETGYVCGDLRAFARRISDLAWNPERRARLSDAARRYTLGRRWPVTLDSLYRAYREAATPRRVPQPLEVRPAAAGPSL